MSTILKALRRLEDDEASRRAEQPAELRDHVVSAPAGPERGRSRMLLWLLAIPAAGLMGALAAALLLPVVLGRDAPSSPAAPAPAPIATSSPEATSPVADVAPVSVDVARTPAPAAPPPHAAPPEGVASPARGASPFSPGPVRAGNTSSAALVQAPSPESITAPGVSSPAPRKGAKSVSSPPSVRAQDASSSAPPAIPGIVEPDSQWAGPASVTGPGVSSPVPVERAVEPSALPPVAAARPLEEEQSRAEPARSIEISEDFAVIERNPLPRVLVTQTIWHPRAERRVAVIERLDGGDGAALLRLREGDRVGSLQLVAIEPTGVVFVHDGIELRRRVGARP